MREQDRGEQVVVAEEQRLERIPEDDEQCEEPTLAPLEILAV